MPRPLRFVVDQNIPGAAQALERLGAVVALPASALGPEAVRDADVLWVRSTVKVNAALLSGSRVRFVATATIGTDHLDLEWLATQGIGWASAPGSNAPSVRLWWAAALAKVARARGLRLPELTVGIVGVGQVGRRIEELVLGLGARVLRCDPPRARAEGAAGFVSLSELCGTADVVTLHVPLQRSGPDATCGLIGHERLRELRHGAILVNASRGAVLDSAALLGTYAARELTVLLDVYDSEPQVDPALVAAATIATPHIAGHSLDGKVTGTQMIYQATCRWLDVPARWQAAALLPPLPTTVLSPATLGRSDEALLCEVLEQVYRIDDDDAAMREIVRLDPQARGAAFGRYRSQYPARREPIGLRVALDPPRPTVARALATLGIEVL